MSMGDNNSANITIADDGSVTVDGGLTVPVTDADGNTADTAVNVVQRQILIMFRVRMRLQLTQQPESFFLVRMYTSQCMLIMHFQ